MKLPPPSQTLVLSQWCTLFSPLGFPVSVFPSTSSGTEVLSLSPSCSQNSPPSLVFIGSVLLPTTLKVTVRLSVSIVFSNPPCALTGVIGYSLFPSFSSEFVPYPTILVCLLFFVSLVNFPYALLTFSLRLRPPWYLVLTSPNSSFYE